jgi:Fe-S cluster assembly protein SufD
MTQLVQEKNVHLSNFTRVDKELGGGGQPWLEKMRRVGIAAFEEAGFPTMRDEEWRFTNVAPIARTPFRLAEPDVQGAREAARQYGFGQQAVVEIVFVNGMHAPELSTVGKLPRGVTVTSLAAAVQSHSVLLEQHLGKYATVDKTPFVALNTGFIRDGAVLHFARGAVVKQPIHLIFVSTPSREPAVSHPRVLIVAEENVQATVVESYVGSGGPGLYFTNAVTELVAAENARIDHCRLQQESLEAYHVSAFQAQLGRGADLISHAATVGGRLTRNDLNVVLNGEGAHVTLNGLVLIGGEQHVDNHTLLHHEKAHCPSHELYKHVLDGRSTGVFKGKIFVQKDAQKTDSKQTSKSLLLSDDATMNAMPALEIYADDVKCTHGSTTGPVDEDMVFYLRTRGVSLEAARHLLTYAFAADITRRISVEPVRRRLEDYMAAQHGLPQDLRITDVGSHDEAAR